MGRNEWLCCVGEVFHSTMLVLSFFLYACSTLWIFYMRLPRMPSKLVFGLFGASIASGMFAFTTRETYRRIAFCAASGAAAGAGLTIYNDAYHCVEYVPKETKTRIAGQPLNPYRPSFESMKDKIFEHISQEYNDLGQIARGEEGVTVLPNVFAQIGIIDEDGIRKLWRMITLDSHQMPKYGQTNAEGAVKRTAPIVFCDLGSGVGNVCLQVLGETSCNSVVGVEIMPSRHEAAEKAFLNASKYYPDVYGEDKHAVFLMKDIVDCADELNKLGVNVIFTHSWMFDDALMAKVTALVNALPSLNTIVTSRPLDDKLLKSENFPLSQRKLVHFSADWNSMAPFYVYARKSE